jgi:lactate racemase
MNTTRVSLPYGHGEVSLDIPSDRLLGVYLPQVGVEEEEEDKLITAAIENPIGTPRLRNLVRKGQKISIVTSDLTRPCPSNRMLPYILKELSATGIFNDDITVILALGLHRAMTEEEISRVVSPLVLGRVRVLNHDVDDTINLGMTSAGTPVEIYRPVVEADIRVCLGNLEFHYFAGYSGGAKAIFPGCASKAGVTANHAMMVRPEAASGRLDRNPVREDLEEAASMVGVDFILNVIVNGDHRVVGAVAGDVTLAHRHGCQMVAKQGTVSVPTKADIVIASAGGFPKDINLYQAHKGLDNAAYFVRDEGVIILLAECLEGFGNHTFKQWILESDTSDDVLNRIQREFVLGGHKAAAIAAVQNRANVFLVSKMNGTEVRKSRMIPFESIRDAFIAGQDMLGVDSKVIVLPQAGSVIPRKEDG